MAKKWNWFNLVKRIFGSETKEKAEKKENRRRWFFGRFKPKHPHAITAAPPLTEKTLSEAEIEQSKHAMAVAIAAAAAAEAAVASVQAAAEVVRLSASSISYSPSENINQESAAIKIQTAFRGYLARKALRALKALVRLQALVRGRAVRRQTTTTLRSLQSLIKIQTQVRTGRIRTTEDSPIHEEKEQVHSQTKELEDIKTMFESNSQRRWDDGFLSKEELDDMILRRRDAASKRERAMEYIFGCQERRNAQRPTTSMIKESKPDKLNWRWSWLEQWMDSQPWRRERQLNSLLLNLDQNTQVEKHWISDAVACLDLIHNDEKAESQLHPTEYQKHRQFMGYQSPILQPRKSLQLSKGSSIRDYESFSTSPTFPNYMASTESAKAKARSTSMPKQRLGVLDSYSDSNSPSKGRHSTSPLIHSDAMLNKSIKPPGSLQGSPRLKGLSGPLKSQRSLKDLSIDSECSLLNWDRRSAFR
ncbi:protein IQ-DOMAIN 12-like [Tasmannia lanceolata]|uniref:protein IQ-DOMAIN 12-like n=1 Tax=Tasmannia lanceolata TaxID=3420 RepID=UPI0040629DCB